MSEREPEFQPIVHGAHRGGVDDAGALHAQDDARLLSGGRPSMLNGRLAGDDGALPGQDSATFQDRIGGSEF